MPIIPVKRLIQGKNLPIWKYVTTADKEEFDELEAAVEHENALNKANRKPVVYEQIWTIQQAINMAVAESRVVRFIWHKPNQSIKKDIVDIKGCKLLKPDKESTDVAVVPPCVKTFDFDEVK